MRVKNNAPGARVFHVRTEDVGPDKQPVIRPHVLESGQEADLDLIQDPKKDKVLRGMAENIINVGGREVPEVEFGGSSRTAVRTAGGAPPEVDFEEMTVDELRAYITDKGQTPQSGALKADLVKQAKSIK